MGDRDTNHLIEIQEELASRTFRRSRRFASRRWRACWSKGHDRQKTVDPGSRFSPRRSAQARRRGRRQGLDRRGLQGPAHRRRPEESPRSVSWVATGHFNVVENTPEIHDLVVCTLCSCYPLSILGIAPNWYKTAAYRSRAVRNPRGVLGRVRRDNSVTTIEVRVWDSTAELRYLVLPERPAGTDGWTTRRLAASSRGTR